MTYKYRPLLSDDRAALRLYVEQSLREIDVAFQLLSTPVAPLLLAEPSRPEDGTIVRADGVRWNPGSGRGVYCYDDGQWKKLDI